jgi:hypothetical protein
MNIVLWVLQVLLALLCFSGGGFKASKPGDLVKGTRVLSEGAWRAIGVLEMLLGVLVVVPAAAPIAAALVAVGNLLVSAVYARISVKLVAANPLIYSVPIALIAAFVAYGRYA